MFSPDDLKKMDTISELLRRGYDLGHQMAQVDTAEDLQQCALSCCCPLQTDSFFCEGCCIGIWI